jgi:dsDNA-specific endonuclease/ATPase MutS2
LIITSGTNPWDGVHRPEFRRKTVALKTIGLLSLMALRGCMSLPRKLSYNIEQLYMSDIGTVMIISENLSTFSSHITNIMRF